MPHNDDVKIGTKVVVGKKRVQKRFTNGHKTFTAAEAKALNELLARENHTRDHFIDTQDTILLPRNPVLGELTPRPLEGIEGTLAVIPGGPSKIIQRKEVTMKIGMAPDMEPQMTTGSPCKMDKVIALRTLKDKLEWEMEYRKHLVLEREEKVKQSLLQMSLKK